MNILLRADCSRDTGTGHLYRCKHIADFFYKKGHKIHFLINENLFNFQILSNYSFSTISTNDINREVINTKNYLDGENFDVIIVDFVDKNLNYDLMKTFRLNAKNSLVAITDEFNKVAINADLVIACHPNQSNYKYLQNDQKVLTGEKYLVVSPEFKLNKINIKKNVKNILINFGGHDPHNVTCLISNLLIPLSQNQNWADITFNFLIGGIYKFEKELRELLNNGELNSVIHQNISSILPLFNNSDLAISAGGNTMYELCHMGIPTITISLNERQQKACNSLEKLDLIADLGFHQEVSQNQFDELFIKVLEGHDKRLMYHNNCLSHFQHSPLEMIYSLINL